MFGALLEVLCLNGDGALISVGEVVMNGKLNQDMYMMMMGSLIIFRKKMFSDGIHTYCGSGLFFSEVLFIIER